MSLDLTGRAVDSDLGCRWSCINEDHNEKSRMRGGNSEAIIVVGKSEEEF